MSKTDSSPRRARRSRSEWASEVARWERSGLSATTYAARHDLSRSTLFWWSSHLRDMSVAKASSESVSFLPVRVRPTESANVPEFALEVTLRNGRTVRTRGEVDPLRLARVLDALEGGGT
jgi:hypothetical protein